MIILDNIIDKFSFANLGHMVLQGICSARGNLFITAYDSSRDKNNSMVYILDKNNICIKDVVLYNNSHVGGICYDDKNEMFWITDKGGTISGYPYEAIVNSKDMCFPKFKKVDVGSNDLINYQNEASVAYIAYDDGKIFVGNFSINGNGLLKSFAVSKDGNILLDSCKKVKFIDKVQGIAFYRKDDCKYLIASNSFGRFNKSKLKIFKYDEEVTDYSNQEFNSYDMPPMIEQIAVNKNNNLITIYESNAHKYKVLGKKRDDVIIFDISNIKLDI